jgi:hypothetical protein
MHLKNIIENQINISLMKNRQIMIYQNDYKESKKI